MGDERQKQGQELPEPKPGDLVVASKPIKMSRTGTVNKSLVLSVQPDPNLQMDEAKIEELISFINSNPQNRLKKRSRRT